MRPRKSEPRLMIYQSIFQNQAFLFLKYLFWVHFLLTEAGKGRGERLHRP